MNRPLLLDLFCGAGGASRGYYLAGFEVVGVDLEPQKNYPFEFHRADAMAFPLDDFVAVHASPPCQRFSAMTRRWGRERIQCHPDLIAAMRHRLETHCVPALVIENVPGAPLIDPVTLCGTMFGLGTKTHDLIRHRIFETNFPLEAPGPCEHTKPAIGVYGSAGGSSKSKRMKFPVAADRREAMEIDWMTVKEMSNAIPPAYTHYIGLVMINYLKELDLV